MPNWERPGRDFPSRQDIQKMERENNRREREYNREQDRIQQYIRNHPSASYAEAHYKTERND